MIVISPASAAPSGPVRRVASRMPLAPMSVQPSGKSYASSGPPADGAGMAPVETRGEDVAAVDAGLA